MRVLRRPLILTTIFLTLASCLVLSWTRAQAHLLDTLPPGHWYEVPNSHLRSVGYTGWPGGLYVGVSGVTDVINGWSGGAYDTKRDCLYVWGGGHQGYAGNEVYAFCLATMTWQRLTDPSHNVDPTGITLWSGEYPDGAGNPDPTQPRSTHTYNTLVYLPAQDRFCGVGAQEGFPGEMTGVTPPQPPTPPRSIHCWNPTTGIWARHAGVRGTGIGAYSAIDPVSGLVWHHGTIVNPVLVTWDPRTDTVTQRSTEYGQYLYGATAVVDPKRKKLIAVGQGNVYLHDLTVPGLIPIQTLPTTGDTAIVQAHAPGVAYDPARDRIVAWAGGTDIYELNLDTLAWTRVAPPVTNTVVPTGPNTNGTFGRFRYIPKYDAFIVVNHVDQDVYLLKGGGTIHQPPPPPSAGPTTPVLTVTAVSSANVTLAWQASTAQAGIDGYWIVRDGEPVQYITCCTTFTETGRHGGTTHRYTLIAVDTHGATSPPSAPVSVTTPVGVGRVLQVGPTRQYTLPSQAAAVTRKGDVVEIDAGRYDDIPTYWRADDLTIRGVGNGRAHIDTNGQTVNGQGFTWVVSTFTANTTLENIELSGGNGGGLSIDDATIRNCYIHDNSGDGIWGGPWINKGTLLIEHSTFHGNGGSGYTHQMYLFGKTVIFRHNYSHHASIGHLLKLRAERSYVLYNRLTGESGNASYELEFPQGGLVVIVGNIIEQGANSQNPAIVSYGAEGAGKGWWPIKELYAMHNTIVNTRGSGTFLDVYGEATIAKRINNNLFVGQGNPGFPTAPQLGNIFTLHPAFVGLAGYDYRPTSATPGLDSAIPVGTAWGGFQLTPQYEYFHPTKRTVRVTSGLAADIGAYEFTGVVQPPPPPPPPPAGLTIGGMPVPSLADEEAAYTRWGWAIAPNAKPNVLVPYPLTPTQPFGVHDPDVHGDFEGDDLLTSFIMWKRTGQAGYLVRATAWARYMKDEYAQCLPGGATNTRNYCYDRDAYGGDHTLGSGLLAWYEHTGDIAYLAAAERIATDVETNYARPAWVIGTSPMAYYGPRIGARHLRLIVDLVRATHGMPQSPRWQKLQDKILALWLQSPDWDSKYGIYWNGQQQTNDDLGVGSYASGIRVTTAFPLALLADAFHRAYLATGDTRLRDRIVAMARFADTYGLDAIQGYTGARFGVNIVTGAMIHSYVHYKLPPEKIYTAALTDLFTLGYIYTGEVALLDKAREHFKRGTQGTLTAPGHVPRFVDSTFDSSSGYMYFADNKGLWQYTGRLFANGGLPTVETSGPPPPCNDVCTLALCEQVNACGRTCPACPIVPPPPPPGDTQAPTMPGNAKATVILPATTQVRFSWTRSTDNVKVVGYLVFRDGTQVTPKPITVLAYVEHRPPGTYRYEVLAVDAAGNRSPVATVQRVVPRLVAQ